MKIIHTPAAPPAIGPYSQGIDTGSLVFFSGQIALTPEGNFVDGSLREQAAQVFANLDALLAEAGVGKNNIAKVTVWLHDLADFAEFNQLYETWLQGHKPARSCVQATLPKNAKVEVEVIGVRG